MASAAGRSGLRVGGGGAAHSAGMAGGVARMAGGVARMAGGDGRGTGGRGSGGRGVGMLRTADLHFVPQVLFGSGTLPRVGPLARGYGQRALLVTDRGVRQSGLVDQVVDALHEAGVESVVFDGVQPNPTIANVEAGLAAGAGRDIAVIVSVGGGSAHDCAKAMALVAANGGEVRDYEGFDRSPHRAIPLLAVNTTAGSGADVSRYAVITDPDRALKMIIADRHLTPRAAINDPLATLGLPRGVTVATGLDALTHAIEAIASTSASDVSDLFAVRAVELASTCLPRVARDGGDLEAREGMLLAATLAGLAINSASVGAVHALAHQLGAHFDLAHGVCNGLLLPIVAEFNVRAAPDRYAIVARALGGLHGPRGVPGALRALGARLGLPRGLGELGVERSALPALVDGALADMCMTTNPRPMTGADVLALYERAL
jgi:alcohol dehydrogenase